MNLPIKAMRRVVLGAVAAVTVIGGTLALSSTASADTPACVTNTEFRQAKRGMTKRQVDRIFDLHGREKGRSSLTVRFDYPHCQRDRLVNMFFWPASMRLKSKMLSATTPSPPADDTPGCVTWDELNQLDHSMPISQVHQILGTSGTYGHATEVDYLRKYDWCEPGHSQVWVFYFFNDYMEYASWAG